MTGSTLRFSKCAQSSSPVPWNGAGVRRLSSVRRPSAGRNWNSRVVLRGSLFLLHSLKLSILSVASITFLNPVFFILVCLFECVCALVRLCSFRNFDRIMPLVF